MPNRRPTAVIECWTCKKLQRFTAKKWLGMQGCDQCGGHAFSHEPGKDGFKIVSVKRPRAVPVTR